MAATKLTKTAQRSLDADKKILERVAARGDFGEVFTNSKQWRRAEDLVDSGHLTRKMIVHSIVGAIVNYRPAFWLTDKGRARLAGTEAA